jgi:cytochrome c oxidase assembly protein subunit 23
MGNASIKSDSRLVIKDTKKETQKASSPVQNASPEPVPEEGAHNAGQPLQANLDPHGKQRSKFLTNCKKEHAASLQCINDNYDDRAKCEEFFIAYKKCRKEEREQHLEQNAKHVKWWS